MSKSEIVPIGKYKGQPIEVLQHDPGYCDWLLKQDGVRTRYPTFYNLIINNFGAPAETPEHNQLQAHFTDPEFSRKLVWHLHSGKITSFFSKRKKECLGAGTSRCEELRRELASKRPELREALRALEEDDGSAEWTSQWKRERVAELGKKIPQLQKKLARTEALLKALEPIPPPLPQAVASAVQFEVDGTDVVIGYEVPGVPVQEWERTPDCTFGRTLHVECKPSLGDDYPAVLRQITASAGFGSWNITNVLLIGTGGYTGTGASLEQVKAIFESRKVAIVFLKDL